MKKYVLLIIILLMPRICYCASVVGVDNISRVPNVANKKTVYIENLTTNNATITVSSDFMIRDRQLLGENAKQIMLKSVPQRTTTCSGLSWGGVCLGETRKNNLERTYSNAFSVTYTNAGYYVDDNGDRVNVDLTMTGESVKIFIPGNLKEKEAMKYYLVAEVRTATGSFLVQNDILNSSYNHISYDGPFTGAAVTLKYTITRNGGGEVDSNIMVPWRFVDIDGSDRTISKDGTYNVSDKYVESVRFNSGFDDTFYVKNGTVLVRDDTGMRFVATTGTGNDCNTCHGEPHYDYSTVVGYQFGTTSSVTWTGVGCGVNVASSGLPSFEYPNSPVPTKESDKEVYKVGDTVSYTIKKKFPYTILSNAAKEIRIVDTFDKALDISNIRYEVQKGSANDKGNWNISVDGQTVTLGYKNSNFVDVRGDYTFTFNNIKILEPDETHRTVRCSEIGKC